MKTKLETFIAENAVKIITVLVCVVAVLALAIVAAVTTSVSAVSAASELNRKVTALEERPVGGARTFYYIQGCDASPALTEQQAAPKMMSEPMRMRQPKKTSGWGTTDFDREIEAFNPNQESNE